MPREKVAPHYRSQEILYSNQTWDLFRQKREIAFRLMEELNKFSPFIHGSIARGDIKSTSDIDLIIPYLIDEFQLIQPLESANYEIKERWIVQATPLSAIKANLILTPEISITIPLIPFYPREFQFYDFGGKIGIEEIKNNLRVPGINKQLLFIEPTEKGHIETRVNEKNAGKIAKLLHISISTILERIRVLERRDNVGRTGIYLKQLVPPDKSFGQILNKISSKFPATRRRIRRKKIT
ncbi:MAG: nucleotidyltransferase domain-containing protein [Candidatus Helarchaeota archaeon]